MIYTLQEGQSFDPEILRVELVKAIGADGWYISTQGNQVDVVFYSGDYQIGHSGIEPVVLAHFANGATREANKAIIKQIAELEATQTPRRVREGGFWLDELDGKIAALRVQLK